MEGIFSEGHFFFFRRFQGYRYSFERYSFRVVLLFLRNVETINLSVVVTIPGTLGIFVSGIGNLLNIQAVELNRMFNGRVGSVDGEPWSGHLFLPTLLR